VLFYGPGVYAAARARGKAGDEKRPIKREKLIFKATLHGRFTQ